VQVFALCSADYAEQMRRVAGVRPWLSPPIVTSTFRPEWLTGARLVFFKLYGEAGVPYWFNREGQVAVMAGQLAASDLSGAVVFVANCYLPESPMLAALFKAGAEAVGGGEGYNYFRKSRLDGADLLGLYFRVGLLKLHLSVDKALELAKWRLRLKPGRTLIERDTLAFKAWHKEQVGEKG